MYAHAKRGIRWPRRKQKERGEALLQAKGVVVGGTEGELTGHNKLDNAHVPETLQKASRTGNQSRMGKLELGGILIKKEKWGVVH